VTTTGAPPSTGRVGGRVRDWVRAGPKLGDLGHLAIAQLGPMPTYFLLNLVTAATLDPGRRGMAALVVGSGAVGATLLFGSMHVGAVLAVRAGDAGAFRRVAWVTAATSLACALAAGTVLAANPSGWGLYSGPVLAQILAGLALMVPLLFLARTVQGLGQARAYRQLMLLQASLYFLGAVFCLLVLGRRSPFSVTIPWLLAMMVTVVAGAIRLRGLLRSVRWSPGVARVTAVGASLAAHSGSVTQQVAYKGDLFLLGWFAPAAAIGLYTLSSSIAEVVWVVPEVLALSVFADEQVRSASDWRVVVARRVRQAVVCSAVAMVAVFAGGAVLLLWFLPDYRGSLPLLAILMPGVVAGAAARVILAALTARDARHLLRLAAAANLTISCLYLPGVALWGVRGAAVASTLIYLLQLLMARRLWTRAVTCTT
jgi:hypothetical protein